MARKPKVSSSKKDGILARYFFHIFALILIVLTVLYTYQYYAGQISIDTANTYLSITLSLMFSIVVISYLIIKGRTLHQVLESLGLSREALNSRALSNGIKLFLLIFILEIAGSLVSQITGIPLPTNVATVLGAQPLYFLLFAVFIGPINEEIFFRGFLVPRIGIIFSALIFAVLHSGYLSISEFAAAFIFGLAAGYIFKKYKSLYASILAHVGINFLAVVALLVVGSTM